MGTNFSVGLFLHRMREIIRESGIVLVPREASLQFLATRGMTAQDVEYIAKALKAEDCFDGPEPDRDERYPGFVVAEFSPIFEGEKLYFKISIDSNAVVCKCLSIKAYRGKGEE